MTSALWEDVDDDKFRYLAVPLLWDLRGFVDQQLGGSLDDLENLVVLSGGLGENEGGHAYAATCGEYVSRFWGREGMMLFRELVECSLGIGQGMFPVFLFFSFFLEN